MLSFNRRSTLALLLGVPLAACGLQPVYAPGANANTLRGAVLVDAPGSRAEFNLVRGIEARLGRPDRPTYGLAVTQSVLTNSLAIQGSSAVTRYNLNGTATYTLTQTATGTVVASGDVTALASFSTNASSSSSAVAETAANRRLAEALADKIVNQLVVTVNLTQ